MVMQAALTFGEEDEEDPFFDAEEDEFFDTINAGIDNQTHKVNNSPVNNDVKVSAYNSGENHGNLDNDESMPSGETKTKRKRMPFR